MKLAVLYFEITDDLKLKSVTVDYNDTGIDDITLLQNLPKALIEGFENNQNNFLNECKALMK